MHHQIIVARGPGDHLQEIVRIVERPHGDGTGRLARRVVPLADAQRQPQDAEHAGEELHAGGARAAHRARDGRLGGRTQDQPELAPQRRGHRGREEHAALEHQSQAVGRLRRLRKDCRLDQRVHQVLIAGEGFAAGAAEPQGGREQLRRLFQREAKKHRMVRRGETRIVHGAREAAGLLLQRRGVHGAETFAVDLQARVLDGRLRGPEYRADQAIGAACIGDRDLRVVQAGRDLGGHRLEMIHAHRALGEDTPDLLDQAVEDVVIADALDEQLQDGPHRLGHATQTHAQGLASGFEQHIEIECEDLREVVMGLLRSDGGMAVARLGHGEEPQLAEALQRDVSAAPRRSVCTAMSACRISGCAQSLPAKMPEFSNAGARS